MAVRTGLWLANGRLGADALKAEPTLTIGRGDASFAIGRLRLTRFIAVAASSALIVLFARITQGQDRFTALTNRIAIAAIGALAEQ